MIKTPNNSDSIPASINPFFAAEIYRNANESDRAKAVTVEALDALERQFSTVFTLAKGTIVDKVQSSKTGLIDANTQFQLEDLLGLTDSILAYLAETRPIVKGDLK